jgi:hypothetical protein
VTLMHHRIARDGSLRATAGSVPPADTNTTSSRRNSSGDSHDTGHSDPKKWFDRSNQNPTATFDNNTMDGTLNKISLASMQYRVSGTHLANI